MTFLEYLRIVNRAIIENPDWRVGQAYFNILYMERPDLANQIRMTPLDPFFLDDPGDLTDFLRFVDDWL